MKISAIVPMYNAQSTIEACLAPLLNMLRSGGIDELIVVNDGSTDRSVELVSAHGDIVLVHTDRPCSGPGAGRNLAAGSASGDYLWFVDADVVLADDAADVLRRTLQSAAHDAVIGSYDDEPAAKSFLSQYKNLVHHYYHHQGRQQASTFWSGCGIMRRDRFLEAGGFDVARFPYPSVEDIDLGYRLRDHGGSIVLVPELQGKHLKEWRFGNLIHTEIFRRAIPWSLLMLEREAMTDDLNVSTMERVRALAAIALAGSTLLALVGLVPALLPLLALLLVVVLNLKFVRFFTAARGPWFASRAFAFHQLYYLYSTGAFAYAWFAHQFRRRRVSAQPTAR